MNGSMCWMLIALIVAITYRDVSAYSSGANPKVCNSRDMRPEHANVGFVESGSNFTVDVLETEYIAGGPVGKNFSTS